MIYFYIKGFFMCLYCVVGFVLLISFVFVVCVFMVIKCLFVEISVMQSVDVLCQQGQFEQVVQVYFVLVFVNVVYVDSYCLNVVEMYCQEGEFDCVVSVLVDVCCEWLIDDELVCLDLLCVEIVLYYGDLCVVFVFII